MWAQLEHYQFHLLRYFFLVYTFIIGMSDFHVGASSASPCYIRMYTHMYLIGNVVNYNKIAYSIVDEEEEGRTSPFS